LKHALTLTLDTNCILDVDEERPSKSAVLELSEAHRSGLANVAYVAQSASERQQNGTYLESYEDFFERLRRLELSHLNEIHPLIYWDISYWDKALWADEDDESRLRQIHHALFPNQWFEASREIQSADGASPEALRAWRNRLCDTLIYWAHDNANRDIFVTSDKKFKRLENSNHFPEARIRTPLEAINEIQLQGQP